MGEGTLDRGGASTVLAFETLYRADAEARAVATELAGELAAA